MQLGGDRQTDRQTDTVVVWDQRKTPGWTCIRTKDGRRAAIISRVWLEGIQKGTKDAHRLHFRCSFFLILLCCTVPRLFVVGWGEKDSTALGDVHFKTRLVKSATDMCPVLLYHTISYAELIRLSCFVLRNLLCRPHMSRISPKS